MLIFLYESDNIMIFESDLKKYKSNGAEEGTSEE